MNKKRGKSIPLDREVTLDKEQLKSLHHDLSNKPEGYTAGDLIEDAKQDWLENIIRTGALFTMDVFDLVDLMNDSTKKELFEKINSLSLIDLVLDYKLDGQVVTKWFERYTYYHVLWEMSNNQFISHSNTKEQIALYYYLERLGMVNFDKIIDEKNKAKMLGFLLNRSTENIRNAMRSVDIKATEKKYLTENVLTRLSALAVDIKFKELKKEVEFDRKRLYPDSQN